MAWIKKNAKNYGGNPDYVVICGGSAGGHLAALVNLTPNDPEFDFGLEQDSTSVQVAVSLYGVYDFCDRFGLWPFKFKNYLAKYVIVSSYISFSHNGGDLY